MKLKQIQIRQNDADPTGSGSITLLFAVQYCPAILQFCAGFYSFLNPDPHGRVHYSLLDCLLFSVSFRTFTKIKLSISCVFFGPSTPFPPRQDSR
jgi:hypothetical protein